MWMINGLYMSDDIQFIDEVVISFAEFHALSKVIFGRSLAAKKAVMMLATFATGRLYRGAYHKSDRRDSVIGD